MRKILHALPNEHQNDASWLRNLILGLGQFECVDIHYERDSTDAEPTGEWDITLTARAPGGKSRDFRSTSTNILEALHDATTQAEQSTDAAYEDHKQRYQTALNKLTLEERRLLRLV